jgi:hypothetical protein
MPHKCEHCGEYFSAACSLKLHQKSARYCLDIQRSNGIDVSVEEYTCDCGEVFTLKGSFTRHKTRCRFVPSEDAKEPNHSSISINNGNINNGTNNGTIINNSIVNNTIIVSDVSPFTIHQLTDDYVASKLTPVITKEVMKLGMTAVTELIIELLLMNDGRYCYWCTDKSRKKFKMLINSDGEINVKNDPNALSLRTVMSVPLKRIAVKLAAADKNATKSIMQTYEEIKNLKLEGSSFVTALASALPPSPDGVDPKIKEMSELSESDPKIMKEIEELEKQVALNQRHKSLRQSDPWSDYTFD